MRRAVIPRTASANHLEAGLPAPGSFYSSGLPVRVGFRVGGQWQVPAFVPGYGGGTATDFHRLPFSACEAQATSTGFNIAAADFFFNAFLKNRTGFNEPSAVLPLQAF